MAAVDDGSSLSTPMEDRSEWLEAGYRAARAWSDVPPSRAPTEDSGDGDASAQVAWMREYRARLEAKAAAEREAIEQRKADAEEVGAAYVSRAACSRPLHCSAGSPPSCVPPHQRPTLLPLLHQKLEDFYHQRTNRLAQAAAAKRCDSDASRERKVAAHGRRAALWCRWAFVQAGGGAGATITSRGARPSYQEPLAPRGHAR